MVNFVLESLESSVTLGLLASVYKSSITDITSDARAVLYVKQSDAKSIFKYQTDSFDAINDPDSDIKYFLHYDKFTDLAINPANAMVNAAESANAIALTDKDGVALAANKTLLAHDFLRHIAKDLFGTHLGVDIFNNEKELMQNIRSVCSDAAEGNVMFEINESVKKVSTESTDTEIVGLKGEAGSKYMTNENDTNENLCRVLFGQMMENASSRFAAIEDSQEEQPLPFEIDDSINFKLTVSPAADQHLLTRSSNNVASRSYEIRLVIVDDNETEKVNTEVAADEV
jgi:hypothetical protein